MLADLFQYGFDWWQAEAWSNALAQGKLRQITQLSLYTDC